MTPGEAIELLRRLTEWPGHSFLNDDVSLVTSPLIAHLVPAGHRASEALEVLTGDL